MMNIECRRFDLLLSLSSIDIDSRNYVAQCNFARYNSMIRFCPGTTRDDVEVTSCFRSLVRVRGIHRDTIDIVNERTLCWVYNNLWDPSFRVSRAEKIPSPSCSFFCHFLSALCFWQSDGGFYGTMTLQIKKNSRESFFKKFLSRKSRGFLFKKNRSLHASTIYSFYRCRT